MEPRRATVELAGVLVDRVDLPEAVCRLRRFLADRSPHHVVTVNTHFLILARRDAGFRAVLKGADLAVADGMPLVWASRLAARPLPARVAGVELVNEACRLAAEGGYGVFLLGASDDVSHRAAAELRSRFPGLRISRYSPHFGPFSADEERRIVRTIREAAPGLLLVALGAPRQDLWIRAHLSELAVPIAMGVGCVLDLLAGRVHRAPLWLRRAGLEWAYRLWQEPGRLWRRYLLDDIPMALRLVLDGSRRGVSRLIAPPRGRLTGTSRNTAVAMERGDG